MHDGNDACSLTYTWLSDGTPVSATLGEGNLPGRLYNGSFVFVTDSTRIDIAESVAWDEGRIFFLDTDTTDCWYAGDHLGNVRSVIDISRGQAVPQVLEQSDYLPYGTRINNTAFASMSGENSWRYAGKEEQRLRFFVTDSFSPDGGYNRSLDLGLLNFGARMYDPFTTRWMAVDWLAKNYPSQSPYSYCLSNPISFVDPDGNAVTEIVLIALAKGTATALFDAGTQVAVHMINGDSFKGALDKIDLVSVGTSFVEGALNIPGIPAGAKAMVISVLRATDVAVDITTERGTESVFEGGKDIGLVVLDALGESAGLVWSDTITQLAKNGIKADLAKGYFWTLKKEDQLFFRNLSETINSDGFKFGVSILMDSGAGLLTEELKEITD